MIPGVALFTFSSSVVFSADNRTLYIIIAAIILVFVVSIGFIIYKKYFKKTFKGGLTMDTYYNPEDLAQFGNMGEDAPELWENLWPIMAKYLKTAPPRQEKMLNRFCSSTCGSMSILHRLLCSIMSQQGYSQEQMIEAIHAAAAIRGGATLAHGLQAKKCSKKTTILR